MEFHLIQEAADVSNKRERRWRTMKYSIQYKSYSYACMLNSLPVPAHSEATTMNPSICIHS